MEDKNLSENSNDKCTNTDVAKKNDNADQYSDAVDLSSSVPRPKIMISLKDLIGVSKKYSDVIAERYGDSKFDPLELLDEISGSDKIDSVNVTWLIVNCQYCQTHEMIEYFKSLNHSAKDVGWLIAECQYCQTSQVFEYYKAPNPDATDVSWLIVRCSYCQTEEMVVYYESLNPSTEDILKRWHIASRTA